jgi:hypothetical protein
VSRFSGCPERPKRDIAGDGGGVFIYLFNCGVGGFG